MKFKIVLISVIALSAIMFTSCKKKYAEISLTSTTKSISNGESMDFSSTKLQSETDNKVEILLESTGTKDLSIASINIEGADAERFSLTKNRASNFVLSVGSSESISVALKTDKVGAYEAALVIKSDAKENPIYTVNLTGTIQ